MLSLATVLAPPPEPTGPVLVAARAVPSGTQLAQQHLAIRNYPKDLIPDGALRSPSDAIGLMVGAGLTRGSVITGDAVLRASELLPGESLAPVRISDPAILQLVSVGAIVSVVSVTAEESVVTLAVDVRVVSTSAATTSTSALGSATSSAGLVVLQCDTETARRLAAWSAQQPLGLAIGCTQKCA